MKFFIEGTYKKEYHQHTCFYLIEMASQCLYFLNA